MRLVGQDSFLPAPLDFTQDTHGVLCAWCVYAGNGVGRAGLGLSDLTSWPILPLQCPPCVHGARGSNVSE